MKELMQRSDGPAIRDTIIWIAAILASAAGGIWFWGTWWCVPFFFVYGVLYGSSSDSRWHECGHGTAFKTRWMNDVIYQIASFMLMRNPVHLALEPRAPPHRYDHRRPRRRDRGDASAGSSARGTGLHRHPRLPLFAADAGAQRLRQPLAGREELHPGDGAAQGGRRRALARRHLRRDDRACALCCGRGCR